MLSVRAILSCINTELNAQTAHLELIIQTIAVQWICHKLVFIGPMFLIRIYLWIIIKNRCSQYFQVLPVAGWKTLLSTLACVLMIWMFIIVSSDAVLFGHHQSADRTGSIPHVCSKRAFDGDLFWIISDTKQYCLYQFRSPFDRFIHFRLCIYFCGWLHSLQASERTKYARLSFVLLHVFLCQQLDLNKLICYTFRYLVVLLLLHTHIIPYILVSVCAN